MIKKKKNTGTKENKISKIEIFFEKKLKSKKKKPTKIKGYKIESGISYRFKSKTKAKIKKQEKNRKNKSEIPLKKKKPKTKEKAVKNSTKGY